LLSRTMRAAVYRGIDQVRLEEVAIPEIGPGEVLVRVGVCGVCGTDLKKIALGLVAPPRIFGHETTGEVAAVGGDVADWAIGDRVAVMHHVPCRKSDCYYCLRAAYAQCPTYKRTGATAGFEPAGGGFAEYVRVLDWCVDGGLVRVPDDVPLEEASFIEPLNTCLKGVRLAGIRAGDTVLIVGQGPIGLLFTQLAKLAGAQVIVTDRYAERLHIAGRLGADRTLDPDGDDIAAVVKQLSEGRGADLAIVAVPSTRVVRQAFDLLRPAGKVLLFAQTRLNDPVEVDAGTVCMQEKQLIGSYSSDIDLQDETAALIFNRHVNVRDLITHRFPLAEINEAIDYATYPRNASLKIMVQP
jgi:L-iditol 2-dehydrogenase